MLLSHKEPVVGKAAINRCPDEIQLFSNSKYDSRPWNLAPGWIQLDEQAQNLTDLGVGEWRL